METVKRIWTEDYTEIIRYKGIDIITRLPSRKVILTSGCDRSPEMMQCINRWLKPFQVVLGAEGNWLLLVGHIEHEFKDGMKIDRSYKVSYKCRAWPLSFTSVQASIDHLRLEEKWRAEAKARKARQKERDNRAATREAKRLDKLEHERRSEFYTGLTPLGRAINREDQLQRSIAALKDLVGID